jgi:hypothetical protein
MILLILSSIPRRRDRVCFSLCPLLNFSVLLSSRVPINSEPKTLQEAIQYFSDPKNCREYLVARRWPNGVTCPRCGADKVAFMEKYNRWQCNAKTHKDRQFTSKTGTIFEDSPLGLDKWLAAMWLIVNCKNGISSYEVGRDIGVAQKSAWHMLHRIRLAMQSDSSENLDGEIEADETYIRRPSSEHAQEPLAGEDR